MSEATPDYTSSSSLLVGPTQLGVTRIVEVGGGTRRYETETADVEARHNPDLHAIPFDDGLTARELPQEAHTWPPVNWLEDLLAESRGENELAGDDKVSLLARSRAGLRLQEGSLCSTCAWYRSMRMATYQLTLETDPANHTVRLRLIDYDGKHLGSNQVRLTAHKPSLWAGLFDTRRHVELYQGLVRDEQDHVKTAEDLLEEIGLFLGQHVLGKEIIVELCRTAQQRTLLVHLPAVGNDALAAAFARVPWEIARPEAGAKSLMERNIVVRAVTEGMPTLDSTTDREDVVRVLLVFAEAPGSRPLAMRREREELRDLFEHEILPNRDIRIDILCHGVTRDVLREQIATNGYHIVHWSGHGHHNLLELQDDSDGKAAISGEELVELINEAGGFIPQLFFLSACLSGAVLDEQALDLALNSAKPEIEPDNHASPTLPGLLDLHEAPGYTGTALSLLRSGVAQVVAMRYSVGDDYARELAKHFYRHLLVDEAEHSTERALALAQRDVLRGGSIAVSRMPVDHANPLLFGRSGRPQNPAPRESRQMDALRPCPQPLLRGGSRELDRPPLFVGRARELTDLNRAWQPGGPSVVVIQGMAGLGKTALAAEAVHLWHGRFRWVLAFQAKPAALLVEDFLRQVDERLTRCSPVYRSRCERNHLDAVYYELSSESRGEDRYEHMINNLVQVLRREPMLIVLDNFESNLEREPRDERYACVDPHWDAVLEMLSKQLLGTKSRVLITTRHRPRALSSATTLWLPIRPLPGAEAGLYVRSHPQLSVLQGDRTGIELLRRMLRVSRGHPLVLDRLAALASDHVALDPDVAYGQAARA